MSLEDIKREVKETEAKIDEVFARFRPAWAPNVPTLNRGDTFNLAATLPPLIQRGGTFSVDSSGPALPTGVTLSQAGILAAGQNANGETVGVRFRYSEP